MAAVLCVLATPAIALAAMVCSEHGVTEHGVTEHATAPSDDAPWTLLEVELPNDDTIEVSGEQAPMSMTEGASAVAPRPVHRTSDARIEASERCEDHVGAQELVSPNERPSLEPPSSVMDVSLSDLPWPHATVVVETIARLPVRAVTARGVAFDVDRPPRPR